MDTAADMLCDPVFAWLLLGPALACSSTGSNSNAGDESDDGNESPGDGGDATCE